MLSDAKVRDAARAQTKYNPHFLEAAFYECRKLLGGRMYLRANDARAMYCMGGEL